MSEHSKPYHGPHVVLSRKEIERLDVVMSYLQSEPDYLKSCDISTIEIDTSICGKLDAALSSHPTFLEPAE